MKIKHLPHIKHIWKDIVLLQIDTFSHVSLSSFFSIVEPYSLQKGQWLPRQISKNIPKICLKSGNKTKT
jgi:hypothetical protein